VTLIQCAEQNNIVVVELDVLPVLFGKALVLMATKERVFDEWSVAPVTLKKLLSLLLFCIELSIFLFD